MYYILCYKGRQLGKPMLENEAREKYEEMRHCFKSISLRQLCDTELSRQDAGSSSDGDVKPISPN